MKTISVKPNQTVFDLAVQHYGTCEAIEEILRNNPAIGNDKAALSALGIDYLSDTSFYIEIPVETGFKLFVDTDSKLVKTSVTREITRDVTTFNL